MLSEEMLQYKNPANLNAVMFSRHFLGCNVVFVKIRMILLFEISPVQIEKYLKQSDRTTLELYRQFVRINPFLLQVVQVLLSNHIQVIPYEYENENFNNDEWDLLLHDVGFPKLAPAFVFPKIAEDRDKVFLQYAEEDEKLGFISTKPLSLTKSYVYPFRVFPVLNKMHYSYRAVIPHKTFQVLYENYVNHTLLHGVFPRTNAYVTGFAKIGPLIFVLCRMIHKKFVDEQYNRVYFMPQAYLLFLCYQRLYSPEANAAMSGENMDGGKVLIIDFRSDNSLSKEEYHNSHLAADTEPTFFKWKIPRVYRKAFEELIGHLSEMPFDLSDYMNQSSNFLPYPNSPADNRVLRDIYQGTKEFVGGFKEFLPEYVENCLESLSYRDGFEIYLQEIHKRKRFSLYGWLKKNKLVRRIYSRLKRMLNK